LEGSDSSFFVSTLPEFLGRMIGIGILGAALGFAIITVEQLFRRATLTVLWGPRETTALSLGGTPISIGGGDDHVWLKGLAPKAFVLWTEHGKVLCRDQQTEKQNEFKNGSTFTVARVQFRITTASPTIHTGSAPPKTITSAKSISMHGTPSSSPTHR